MLGDKAVGALHQPGKIELTAEGNLLITGPSAAVHMSWAGDESARTAGGRGTGERVLLARPVRAN